MAAEPTGGSRFLISDKFSLAVTRAFLVSETLKGTGYFFTVGQQFREQHTAIVTGKGKLWRDAERLRSRCSGRSKTFQKADGVWSFEL